MSLLHLHPIGSHDLGPREPEVLAAPDALLLDEDGELEPQPEVDHERAKAAAA